MSESIRDEGFGNADDEGFGDWGDAAFGVADESASPFDFTFTDQNAHTGPNGTGRSSGQGGQHRADPPPSLADEAVRMLSFAQDWLQRSLSSPQATSNIATGSADCQWCPVCQVISVLRGERPELAERFAETQTALAGLVHVMTDAVTSAMSAHAHNHAPQEPQSTTSPEPGTPGSRVHKIPLDIQRSADEHTSE